MPIMWAMTTKQGTAMPETALCSDHYDQYNSVAVKNAHASNDYGGGGFRKVTGNTELHCIVCGWPTQPGICTCGHTDYSHFDEVGFCMYQTPLKVNCGCERFKQV